MGNFLAVLLLIGITVIFLAGNLLTETKNQLAALISLEPLSESSLIRQNGRKVLVAQIYSTFPFNHKHLITINAGAKNGVEVGFPVTLDGNVLLGKVVEVSDNQSVIQTIFDQGWSMPVRIGANAADALLVGGQNPKLTLIDKMGQVLEGEQIVSAQKDFPYGLKIGTIRAVHDLVAHSFKEAEISLFYDIKNLREVAVIIK